MEVGFVVFMSCSIMQRDGHKKKHFLKIGVTMKELRQYVVQVRLWADNGGWRGVVVVLGSARFGLRVGVILMSGLDLGLELRRPLGHCWIFTFIQVLFYFSFFCRL